MPLQLVLEKLDDLPDALHDLYEEKDGKFHLIPPEGFVAADSVEDVGGLKSALQKERDARREAERKQKAQSERYAGIDVDKYKEYQDAEAHAAEREAEKKGEWDKLKEQMNTKHAAEIENLKGEIRRRDEHISRMTRENAVLEGLTKAGGNVELLKPHVMSRTRLNEDDFSLEIIEPDGTPKVDAKGNPVTLDVLIAEMAEDKVYASAFAGTSQSGSGSEPQKGGEGSAAANGGKPIPKEGLRRSTMTPRQKVDFQKEHGLDAFMELPQ